MPVKAAAGVPVYSWAGCYIGAQLGAAKSKANWDYKNVSPFSGLPGGPILLPGADFEEGRPMVGGQAGCNVALFGPWVVGIEAGWASKAMNSTQDNGRLFTGLVQPITTDIKSIGSLTARLGYSFGPDWLLYVKGGYAGANIETSGTTNVIPGFSGLNLDWHDTKWHHGWTVGGGVEYRLFKNVTIGADYSYYRFGSADHVGAVSGGIIGAANQVEHRVDADVHAVMARVNFGAGPTGKFAPDNSRFAGTFQAFSNTEAKYSSWKGTRGTNTFSPEPGKGNQVYVPQTIGINYDQTNAIKVEARIKSGYVSSHHQTSNQLATYTGPVDTQVSFNTTFMNFDNVRPTFGVAVNLPTGTSYLPGVQRFARMDPDLVDIGSYGAGFNVNPTAGFVLGLNQSTAISLSAGYAWQGVFEKEGVDLNANGGLGVFTLKRRINPGDAFTANANISSSFTQLDVTGSFAYMSETEVTVDGLPVGRAGARYVSNLAASYQFDDRWALALNGSWSFSEKNEISNSLGGLMVEPKNSNSHVLIGSVEPTYQLTDRLRLGVNYSVLWRSDNFYDQIESQFIPAKTKQSVGASANYALSPTASIELRGSHAWIEEDTGAFLPVSPTASANFPPSLTYTAWMASISANFRF